MGLHATYAFPTEIAQKMATEVQDQVALISYHPMRCGAFFPRKSLPDASIHLFMAPYEHRSRDP